MIAAAERIHQGASATITATLRDQHGEPAAPSGTVTVGVTQADGTVVLAAGTATTSGGVGIVTVGVPASATADLGVLTATWTDGGDSSQTVTAHEIVGGFYATVADLRSADEVFADRARYPDAVLRDARHVVEVEFETVCGVAFVPRYRRFRVPCRGHGDRIFIERMLRRVLSARRYTTATDYDAIDPVMVAAIPPSDGGDAWLADGWPTGELVVECEVGYDRPPADVLGAFWTRVRDVANRRSRGLPDRTSSFTSAENGTFSLIVPGQRGAVTGIPDVDVVLDRYSPKAPGIA